MSKFVRMMKNMSKVQKMVALGVSTVLVCGAVAGGVLWYNNSSDEAGLKAESEKILAEAEDMDTEELSEFLDNNVVDLETRKELEEKLDEKYSKEDATIATKPSEEEKEEPKPSEDKKEESSNTNSNTSDSKPSTGGTSTSKPSTGGSSKPAEPSKPQEPQKPAEPPKPSRPSGYSSSVTNEFWANIDKGMVNNTSEDAENIPRVHKDLKAKLDNITAGYVNRTKSASQTKSEILAVGPVNGWSYRPDFMVRPVGGSITTISVSGDLSAKQAGQEIYKKWTNGTWEIPYSYVNCKVYYESSNNTYVAYLVGNNCEKVN